MGVTETSKLWKIYLESIKGYTEGLGFSMNYCKL